MRQFSRRVLAIAVLAIVGIAAGCGGVNNLPKTITATITPRGALAIDQGQKVTLTASLINDVTNAGVSWSLSGVGSLSGATTSAVTYNAPATVASATMVTITATPIANTADAVSFTIDVAPTPSVTSTGALPAATVGSAYSSTLTAGGGAGTLTWALANGSTLPAGLTLSKSGVISGTVSGATNASFTVTATDSSVAGAQTATSTTLTITVNPVTLAVTPPTLANAIQGKAYTSSPFTATGGTGAITWSATGLPPGLSIDPASGAISGTPTSAGTVANLVVTATDSGTGSFQQSKSTAALSLTVYPTLTVGSLSPLSAVQNVTVVNLTATSTGGAGAITWSASGLPAGVTIASATGAITGTPTASGTFNATITATDAGTPQQTVSTALALTVIARLTVTTPTLANAVQAVLYTTPAFTAAGGTGTITWSATGLPAGLSINSSTGVISGTPTASGTSSAVVVTATDAGTGALQQTVSTSPLSINVIPTLSITTASLPAGTVGAAYTTTLVATGGVTPYTWSVTGLPAGLALNTATGLISGTPIATNAGAATITVTDSGTPQQSPSVPLTLTVGPGTPVVTTGALPSGTVGVVYAQTLGYNPEGQAGAATWALTGSLPAGLSFNTATGAISGSPTTVGTSNFSVAVTVGGVQSAAQNLSIGIYSALTVTSSATPPNAQVGTAYSFQMQAGGGSGTGYTWSVPSGTLPAGLALNAGTGAISGTPTAAGTSNFTVQVTDSASATATQAVTLVVNPAPPTITTTTLPNASVNVVYNQTLQYSYGGTGSATWNLTGGSLAPVNLSMNTGGVISGTPSATGSASFTVTVTVNGQTSAPVTLTVNAVANPSITTSSLPPAYVGVAYSQTLAASGGSGTGYTWTVTSGQATLTQLGLSLSNTGVLSGTPTATGSGSVTFQVKDSNGLTGSAPLNVAAYADLNLPSPNPTTLPGATPSTNYNGSIAATGGAPGNYVFTVNNVAVPNDSSLVTLTNGLGLSVSSSGNGTLVVSGTPSSTGTVNFSASVKDSAGTSVGPVSYSITVATTYSISGQVNLASNCGGGSSAVPGVTVTLGTHSATTDNNGNYTISGLSNGTYTLTPSITGPSSAFYPVSQSVTINGANATGTNFSVNLGYTVSGTVAYTGSQTGPIYLSLNASNCNGSGTQGTSISAPGAYTIQGVPPGSYTLQAWRDSLGSGSQNPADATGSTSSVNLTNAALTGINVSLSDPSAITLTSAPKIKGASGMNNAALIQYSPVTDNNGMELATSYTLQWSTDQTFATGVNSQTFTAGGTSGAQLFLLNSAKQPSIANGSKLYFRLSATAGSSTSPYSSVVGPVTIGAPSGANTVTGTVTFTGTATGPLYTGFYDQGTGNFYGEYIANPVSPQPFSIAVLSSTDYVQAAILDQDNNGEVNAGDITNVGNGSHITTIAITSSGTQNLTLSGVNSIASVTTDNFQQSNSNGNSQSYSLTFTISPGIKLPVAVQLISPAPNMLAPMDIANCGNCGHSYQINLNIGTTAPKVGDTYSFKVLYSDDTSETVTAQVTAVVTDFATALTPNSTTVSPGTQPTFTWSYPASNAASYTYSFYLFGPTGNIWQIPGQNSNSNGFANTVTPSISWGTDPTGGGSSPSVGNLTSGTTYAWQIQVRDSNGNTSTQNVSFTP